MLWRSVLLGWVVLCTTGISPLLAAPTHSVTSDDTPLNVRSGPGMEYSVVSRLPHGTKVVLRESWGAWAKITTLQGKPTGWVLQRYLTSESPVASEAQTDMDPQEERRRFTRLQRKGIIAVQRSGTPRGLRLIINFLVWYRLTPHQQENFLRRARRFYGRKVVEMRDQRNDVLLARLTATGDVEFAAQPFDAQAPPNDTAPTTLPADSAVSESPGPRR